MALARYEKEKKYGGLVVPEAAAVAAGGNTLLGVRARRASQELAAFNEICNFQSVLVQVQQRRLEEGEDPHRANLVHLEECDQVGKCCSLLPIQ